MKIPALISLKACVCSNVNYGELGVYTPSESDPETDRQPIARAVPYSLMYTPLSEGY